jgi:hypothetical protein
VFNRNLKIVPLKADCFSHFHPGNEKEKKNYPGNPVNPVQ